VAEATADLAASQCFFHWPLEFPEDAGSVHDGDLFDRWERVWHEGRYDLVPSCVTENYIRYDEKGDRTVTRDAYAAEIAAMREERPGIRVVVYDHSFAGDRAWFRFSFKWPDQKNWRAAK
jgi:hypothetical protein